MWWRSSGVPSEDHAALIATLKVFPRIFLFIIIPYWCYCPLQLLLIDNQRRDFGSDLSRAVTKSGFSRRRSSIGTSGEVQRIRPRASVNRAAGSVIESDRGTIRMELGVFEGPEDGISTDEVNKEGKTCPDCGDEGPTGAIPQDNATKSSRLAQLGMEMQILQGSLRSVLASLSTVLSLFAEEHFCEDLPAIPYAVSTSSTIPAVKSLGTDPKVFYRGKFRHVGFGHDDPADDSSNGNADYSDQGGRDLRESVDSLTPALARSFTETLNMAEIRSDARAFASLALISTTTDSRKVRIEAGASTLSPAVAIQRQEPGKDIVMG